MTGPEGANWGARIVGRGGWNLEGCEAELSGSSHWGVFPAILG
jgi:hypothetical protein